MNNFLSSKTFLQDYLIIIIASSIGLSLGYSLIYLKILFPNDGVAYIASADYFLKNMDLKDAVYDPVRDLISPQVSQIFVIAFTKLLSAQYWFFLYFFLQINTFFIAYKFFQESSLIKKNELLSFVLLIGSVFILPIFYRNMTNFNGEGFFFPLMLIYFCIVWKGLSCKLSNLSLFSIFFLGLFLIFFRIQVISLILAFLILMLIKQKYNKEDLNLFLALISSPVVSFCVYIFFLQEKILDDVLQNTLLFDNFFQNIYFNTVNLFSFPFFHEKYFPEDSFLIFKTIIFSIFAFLIVYNFRSILKSNKDLLILSILAILGSLFFISLLGINSQRFFLIPYFFFVLTLMAYWDFNPLKSLGMLLFIIFFGFIYFFINQIDDKSFETSELRSDFSGYYKAIDFFEKNYKNESLALACSKPRFYYWHVKKACIHLIEIPNDYASENFKVVDKKHIFYLGTEKELSSIRENYFFEKFEIIWGNDALSKDKIYKLFLEN